MIEINVLGKKAALCNVVDLNTGNIGGYVVAFWMDFDDPVWANRSLQASFVATTHRGARTMAVAPVDLACRATIPESMLRERAARLEVALRGVNRNGKTVDTNTVNLGPVRQGAGGDGFFGEDCGCVNSHALTSCGSLQELWRFTMAKLADFEPAARRMLGWLERHRKTLEEHPAQTVAGETGVHGLRYWDGKLQVYDGADWIDIGAGAPPGPASWDGTHNWDGNINYQ